jgi:hypothetical protein
VEATTKIDLLWLLPDDFEAECHEDPPPEDLQVEQFFDNIP